MQLTRRMMVACGMAALGAAPALAQGGRLDRRDLFASRRAKFVTAIRYDAEDRSVLPSPPQGLFELVSFPSPVGALGAYVTPDPRDGKKHPAIVWLTGGETNTVGDVWSPRTRDDDQSAAAYRKSGVVTMFPSLRGGNNNPGKLEGFFGEVDDVLAAAGWLAQQPWVDPDRIYLGGHSTGGTLALLVAEASGRFRATFAFGAVDSVTRDYGHDFVRFDLKTLPLNSMVDEALYRAPGYWTPSITSRVFVIEGTVDSNIDTLREIRDTDKKSGHNPNIHFVEVPGLDHFSVLAPANEVIARAILADTGPATNIALTGGQLKKGAR